MTTENIKSACEKYFLSKIKKERKKTLVCDILAGEQGPSCKIVSQTTGSKVVYVRKKMSYFCLIFLKMAPYGPISQ